MSLLSEIAAWKLEAESEDTNRYFYHVDDLKCLEDGQKHFVIGRKGTGKTAICEYFQNKESHDNFTIKLSFKEFPFNILYKLEDNNFTRPSQYISIWKFFIYNAVLKMMARSERVAPDVTAKLLKIYPNEPLIHMEKTVSQWTSKEIGLQLFGLGGSDKQGRDIPKIEDIWHNLIPIMEEIIVAYIDSSKYYIVFDELDEDYRYYWDDKSRDQYIALITSLFKAVSNIKKTLRLQCISVFPIVFLRDDIYSILSDPDSNKWEDDKIYLRWNRSSLKNMIAWRVVRSNSPEEVDTPFDEAMDSIFATETVRAGTRKSKAVEVFDYISSLTHERPRDYVRYLRDCAKSSLAQGHIKIQRDTIRGVEKEYSNHLKTEIVNEIQGIIPDIRSLLDVIGSYKKERFSSDNFFDVIEEYVSGESSDIATNKLGTSKVIRLLFHFSVIGNVNNKNANVPKFKYQNEYLVFNPNEAVAIHRGLLRALGIIDPWAAERY